ncbi:MAG: aspartate kinase [Bacteroidetes bacterium]|nr:aspartate kinase [Bacteroidota bacterium]
MKVLKFGGTSVGSAERLQNLVKIINDGQKKIIVLSAISGTTNKLSEISNLVKKNDITQAMSKAIELESLYLDISKKLLKTDEFINKAVNFIKNIFTEINNHIQLNFSNEIKNVILSKGELLSTNLFHFLLQEHKIENIIIPALSFMKTCKNYEPDLEYIKENLNNEIKNLKNSNLYITQGFICLNDEGAISNLGRGGSDYSASLIAEALQTDEVEIWTDIDGFHNNDPRFVDDTFVIKKLSFEEAAELAYFGAKILHPASIRPCQRSNINVRLKNTLNPSAYGTIISKEYVNTGIKAVAAKDNITIIKIKSTHMLMAHGFLMKIFAVFAHFKTSIDMIATSEVSVSVTIDNFTYLNEIVHELKSFSSVKINNNQSIICVVGDFRSDQKGVVNKIFTTLQEIPIRMISYGGNKFNISLCVDSIYKTSTLQYLNNLVIDEFNRTNNLITCNNEK